MGADISSRPQNRSWWLYSIIIPLLIVLAWTLAGGAINNWNAARLLRVQNF